MTKRPRGAKYRGLMRRGDTIYYCRVVDGKRKRFSLDTSDWEVAAQARVLGSIDDQHAARVVGRQLEAGRER